MTWKICFINFLEFNNDSQKDMFSQACIFFISSPCWSLGLLEFSFSPTIPYVDPLKHATVFFFDSIVQAF